jgi:DNA-binding SARP family transcriptional activator
VTATQVIHPARRGTSPATSALLTAHFFGDFSLNVYGRKVDRWHSGKSKDVLQYLLLNRGQVVRQERMQEILWPGREWSAARTSLKVAIHSIRSILKNPLDGEAKPQAEIICRGRGYLLQADNSWLDIHEFDLSMATGRRAQAGGDEATALTAYRKAANLYHGDFLAAQTADWIDEQRQHYRALTLYALAYLRREALRRNDHSMVIRLCRRMLDIDPYQEDIYQTMMLVHGQRGELGQVREWYRLCDRRFRIDLDLKPAEDTERIFRDAMGGGLRRRIGLAG